MLRFWLRAHQVENGRINFGAETGAIHQRDRTTERVTHQANAAPVGARRVEKARQELRLGHARDGDW